MLWIPGPTEVRPEVLAELARPAIGHRSKAMIELLERIDPHLHHAFGLEEGSSTHVAVHSVSATAMMESSLLGAGKGKVLCLVNGAFSRRWSQIAASLGREVVALEAEWGEVVDLARVEQALEEQGPFDAVTVVSSETSTGTATPLGPLGELVSSYPGTWLCADLVSWIAGAPVDFDANHLDFAFAGVQKAFALPPGISVLAASDRYLERARDVEHRGFALDPVRVIEGHEARKTPATPAIPHHYALARQLEDISAGRTLPTTEQGVCGPDAWAARFALHRRMQDTTIRWAEGHGLSLLPGREYASPTVSCIRSGELDVAALVAGLKEKDFEISNGYGPLKGQTFRIGHMGDHDEEGLARLLSAADEVLGVLA